MSRGLTSGCVYKEWSLKSREQRAALVVVVCLCSWRLGSGWGGGYAGCGDVGLLLLIVDRLEEGHRWQRQRVFSSPRPSLPSTDIIWSLLHTHGASTSLRCTAVAGCPPPRLRSVPTEYSVTRASCSHQLFPLSRFSPPPTHPHTLNVVPFLVYFTL